MKSSCGIICLNWTYESVIEVHIHRRAFLWLLSGQGSLLGAFPPNHLINQNGAPKGCGFCKMRCHFPSPEKCVFCCLGFPTFILCTYLYFHVETEGCYEMLILFGL